MLSSTCSPCRQRGPHKENPSNGAGLHQNSVPREWYFMLPFPAAPSPCLRAPSSLISVPLSVPVLTGASRYRSSQPLGSSPSSVDDIKTKASIHTQKRLEEK